MIGNYIVFFFVVPIVLSTIVLLSSRHHPARYILLLFLASVFIWNATLTYGTFAVQSFPRIYWYWLVLLGTSLLHGMTLLGFCVQFPTRTNNSRWRRWLFALLIAAAIWLFIMGATAWVDIDKLRHGLWNLLLLCTLYWIMCCLIVGITYLGSHLRAIRGQERLQVGYFLIGLGCVVSGYLLIASQQPTDVMSFITGKCTLLTLIFPILATYALLRSPLVGLNSLIRSATVNAITVIVLSLLLTVLICTATLIFTRYFSFSFQFYGIAFIILFSLLLQPCRDSVIRIQKRWIKQSTLQLPDALLQQIIQTCLTTTEPRVLIGVLTQAVQQTMQSRSLAILRPTQVGHWEKTSSLHQQDRIPQNLTNDDVLIPFYQQHTAPSFSDILVQQRGELLEVGLHLQAWGVSLVLPIVTEGKMTGMILLGEKESGDAYTAEDLRFLHELCTHVILALDRTNEFEDLRMSADALYAKVNEQRRELINVNKDLQLAVHAKENFLAIVSHELLTPLTAILGWIDVAKLNSGNHEIVMKSLDVCLSNANRQRRLIRDLLDASRLSHGKLSISRERCALWELATQSVESVQQMAEEKSITIKMVPPSTRIFVHVDPMRFVQVISNLLTNAIKFTPSKGSITVTGTQENNTAKIAITDTGHGIEQEDLVHIFDLFHQGSYHQSGVGIGLALVKGILDLHGGAIQVSSPGVGLGSTFTIEIPVENPTVTPSNAPSNSRATTLML